MTILLRELLRGSEREGEGRDNTRKTGMNVEKKNKINSGGATQQEENRRKRTKGIQQRKVAGIEVEGSNRRNRRNRGAEGNKEKE